MAAVTGIRAPNPSNRTSLLLPNNSCLTSEADEDLVIKQYALAYLGHGYNTTKENEAGKLLGRITQDFRATASSAVDIRSAGSTDVVAIAESTKEVIEELKKGFTLSFNLSFPPDISLGCSINAERISQSSLQTKKIIFAAVHIKEAHCVLAENLILNMPRDQLESGCAHVVRSGWVYTGYKIFFEITTQFEREATETNVQIGGSIGIKSWGFGTSVNILASKLRNKKITDIKLYGEAFGNYSFPQNLPVNSNLVEIDSLLKTIREDFLQKIHKITVRRFIVDEHNLLEVSRMTSQTLPTLIPKLPPLSTLLTTPSSNDTPVNDNSVFYKLAENILTEITSNYKQTLDGILATNDGKKVSIGTMFRAINEVFSKIFDNNWHQRKSLASSYTMIMGLTGAGKSTIVGYLMGASLTYDEDNDRLDYQSNAPLYPEIGHGGASKTKGYQAYDNYIDVAGFFDKDGVEFDICNAMALSMATRILSPSRIMIVFNSAFLDNRAIHFMELIRKLRKIMPSLSDEEIKNSFLFLINNPISQGQVPERIIQKKIENTIKALEDEKKKLLEGNLPNSIFSKRSGIHFNPKQLLEINFDPKQLFKLNNIPKKLLHNNPEKTLKTLTEKCLKSLSDDIREKVEALEENICFLKILHNEKCFHVVNCLGDETRARIKEWEKESGLLNSNSFSTEGFVYNGVMQFKMIVFTAINYFNNLFKKIRKSNLDLKQIKNDFEFKSETLRNFESMLSMKNFKSEKIKNEEQIRNCQNQIQVKIEEKKRLEEEKVNKEQEKKKLENKEERIPYKNIVVCDGPIFARSIFSTKKVAKKYLFKYNEPKVPLLEIQQNIPSHGSKTKNRGKFIEKINKLESGEYSANYRPAWWGNSNDGQASISCFVKEKDHPKTQQEISNLTLEIKRLDDQIKGCKIAIEHDESEIRNLQKIIQEDERDQVDVERRRAMAADYKEELEALILKWRELGSELIQVQEEITTHQNFCQLLRKIVMGMDFYRIADATERSSYDQFFRNLDFA